MRNFLSLSCQQPTRIPLWLNLLALSMLWPTVSGAGQLTFTNGDSVTSELIVGDDLFVQVSLAPPFTLLDVYLRDESGEVIAVEKWSTDEAGNVDPLPLWFRSGVVGCDSDRDHDPRSYRFHDFDEAEAFLEGRLFRVDVVTSASGALVASKSLPTKVVDQPRYFFSDSRACPRFSFFRNEEMFLSGRDVGPVRKDIAIYLVAADKPYSPFGLIYETRELYSITPQTITPLQASGDWTLLLSDMISEAGGFGVIVQEVADQPNYWLSKGHLWVGSQDPRGNGGITVQDWSCPGDCENDPTL